MRAWPNAPRDCLLERIFCRPTIWVDSSVMFFCALSMTASRSCTWRRLSVVRFEVSCRFCPMRRPIWSSRWSSVRDRCSSRPVAVSAIACSRPAISASRISRSPVRRAVSWARSFRDCAEWIRSPMMTASMSTTAPATPRAAWPSVTSVVPTTNTIWSKSIIAAHSILIRVTS